MTCGTQRTLVLSVGVDNRLGSLLFVLECYMAKDLGNVSCIEAQTPVRILLLERPDFYRK